ncbi:MAG: SAM-dependent methyltransferase [Desulfuromonas sp.]|uniref:tRNA1(Val) (adenine(37)-N6)-methyltransferase n=1 Tax=Desulfuromonas sp. TaxID=892 RepID=UPI000CB171A2|nr:tRNA1(Val) (adenine(37)-N6)-methyltransferase [Desulfuromonas sp.]PLX82200.1 MAG: SAM-dependent methyltransferase [Desulfuromonas sp.]
MSHGPTQDQEWAGPDETLDELRLGGLKIIQGRKGYRFSLDPVLLCAFASIGEGEAVADLGTGSGVIPLVVARRTGADRVLGIEIQRVLADRARRSVRLNGLEGRVEILEGDLRGLREELEPRSFDVVLANPPFRRSGTGRHAPTAERAMARHELAGGLEDFLGAAAYLLPEGGRFYIVFLAERLAELLSLMGRARLEPRRLRCVHPRQGEEARMVLVEGRKGGGSGLVVMPPLVIYGGPGREYSPEVLAIYGGKAPDGAPG